MDAYIVFAFPVFGLMILAEAVLGLRAGRANYRLNDTISNVSQGLLNQITLGFTNLLLLGLYALVYARLGGSAPAALARLWDAWYGWPLAIVLVDFCGYWAHRCSHHVAVLWAAHVVHHQSQTFNFSTALRQESAFPILGGLFYAPLALLGLPPQMFALAWMVVLLYQVWIHTELVGNLGWFDRVFASPSNHRVHHALNDCYIDRNFGGLLIVWDRIFGTFTPEGEEACLYGTRPLLNSWDPLWANAIVYGKLLQDAWHARRWSDKLRVWFMPPGWRPADVAQRFPRPPFSLAEVRRFDPPLGRTARLAGVAQFLLCVLLCSAFLWYGRELGMARQALIVAALSVGLWLCGALLQGRMGIRTVLLADAALAVAAYLAR